MSKWVNLLKETYNEWSEDNCLRLGAALAFYTFGSLIPLLLVLTSLATFFLQFTAAGQDIRGQIIGYVADAAGQGEDFRQELEQATAAEEGQAAGSIISTIIGFITLLLAASGVFGQLYESMNIIFDVPETEKPQGVWAFVKSKITSFAMVGAGALLLLVVILFHNFSTVIIEQFALAPEWLFSLIFIAIQFLIVAFVFAAVFRYVPEIDISWKDAFIGGIATSFLWSVGQYLLSLYFANAGTSSSYGIIGSILAFLLYIYYASQILFMGGEFTQVYARSYGSLVQPEGEAEQRAVQQQAFSPQSALVVGNVMATSEQRLQEKEQQLSDARSRQVAAAATGSVFGLLLGAVLGCVALVVGVARSLSRLRGTRV